MNPSTEAAMNAARAIVEPHLREDTARTIDRECLLPEKHAALLLAQGLVDAAEREKSKLPYETATQFVLLRTALSKLR